MGYVCHMVSGMVARKQCSTHMHCIGMASLKGYLVIYMSHVEVGIKNDIMQSTPLSFKSRSRNEDCRLQVA